MKFAIIAAGEGSRLANEGIKTPKPIIKIQGVPIIERLVILFASLEAKSICIIINNQQPETLQLLQKLQKRYPIELVVKDTPSSMHSLHALSHLLRGDKFCLTTVDTIFKEKEFAESITFTLVVKTSDEQAFVNDIIRVTDARVEPVRMEEIYLAWPEDE